MVFNLFNKNIHHYPTLPSLAFGIFRSNFIPENTIPQLSGKIAQDIRQGYTGGAVDVYIPKPPNGVKIKGYDVNSLYPKQMFDRLMLLVILLILKEISKILILMHLVSFSVI